MAKAFEQWILHGCMNMTHPRKPADLPPSSRADQILGMISP